MASVHPCKEVVELTRIPGSQNVHEFVMVHLRNVLQSRDINREMSIERDDFR